MNKSLNWNTELLSPQWYLSLNGTLFGRYYTRTGALCDAQRYERNHADHAAKRAFQWDVQFNPVVEQGLALDA